MKIIREGECARGRKEGGKEGEGGGKEEGRRRLGERGGKEKVWGGRRNMREEKDSENNHITFSKKSCKQIMVLYY